MKISVLTSLVALLAMVISSFADSEKSKPVATPVNDPCVLDPFLARYLSLGGSITYTAKASAQGSVLDGVFTIRDKNDTKLVEGTYKNGVWDGELLTFHSNGRISFRELFDLGKSVGTETHWDDTGKLLKAANYVEGEKEGLETYWLTNGDIDVQIRWKKGNPEWVNLYQSGKIAKTYSGESAAQFISQKTRERLKSYKEKKTIPEK